MDEEGFHVVVVTYLAGWMRGQHAAAQALRNRQEKCPCKARDKVCGSCILTAELEAEIRCLEPPRI